MTTKEENILLNAEQLFAHTGFDGTSIRDIAKKAQVNLSMISYYFGSKEKLFERIFEYRLNESLAFSKDVLANKEINAWQKLIIIVKRYAERIKNFKSFYQIMQREQLRKKNQVIIDLIYRSKLEFLNIYQHLITDGLAEKIFTKQPRLEFVHSTVSGTIFSAMNNLPLYEHYFSDASSYLQNYYQDLTTHLENILATLLGYEEKI